MMMATTIILVILPVRPFLMLCIPDIPYIQLKKARLKARSLQNKFLEAFFSALPALNP